ncbi:MAG TPA: FAD-dependent oxidoreductase, partial [Thermoleophilaceae bacterium]|nr:FAD-dependent oxidoreductase [Thermoleophilaceae bacterium]
LALAPLAGAAGKAPRGRTMRADVVVIGAGPAGLVAATRIAAAGRSVIVLEARRRVGGRVKNWRCGMPPACDCAQLVAPAHTRVRAYAKQTGVRLYKRHSVATGEGNDVLYSNGQRFETPTGGPLNSRAIAPFVADAHIPFTLLDSMAATVPAAAPWEADRADEWDATTVETWKRQATFTPAGQFWVDLLVWVLAAATPAEVSLLHMLGYLARLGDGKHGTDEVLEFLFHGDLADGGLGQVFERLAARLGKRVVLGAPARRIVQEGGRVRVESDDVTVSARRAIVATAPSLNALIDFRPGLPEDRAQLAQRYPQGSVTTFAAIYERPFWRDDGLTGVGGGLQPFFTVADNSPPDGSSGRLVLTSQSFDQRRYARLPARERRRIALDNAATYLGERARKPMMVLERNWSGATRKDAPWVDPLSARWTRGCPGYLPPGVLRSYGPAIREPFGHVHWANTEHSTSYNTYVEGAVRSAEAVAKRVLAEV